ncbi:hypothetical protein M3Y96_00823300 [Aphelenchoides besseyi]|nr:hypothetical protein M3Y96_00823300 [Aphelenchoides besseyi]
MYLLCGLFDLCFVSNIVLFLSLTVYNRLKTVVLLLSLPLVALGIVILQIAQKTSPRFIVVEFSYEEEELGKGVEVEHLSDSTFPTPIFPAQEKIHGHNLRFMVPLVVQHYGKPDSKVIKVWFLVDSGSPYTCITVKTLEPFLGAGNIVGLRWFVNAKRAESRSTRQSSTDDKIYSMLIQAF